MKTRVPWWLAMTAATAPAAWAFSTFSTKKHWPRSMRAIFPFTATAFEKAEHPSVDVDPIAASTGSSACTISPPTPGLVSAGPKAAPPAL